MIRRMNKHYLDDEVKNILNPTVKTWFFKKFKAFSLPQKFGVMEIHKRNNILISAPTHFHTLFQALIYVYHYLHEKIIF